MSIKKNLKNSKGLTLVEILIGIVITTIIMAALFTTYTIVNQTYTQVSEKAKISRSSRDLVSMLMRDIRMSGFRYYASTQTIAKYAADTGGCILPNVSYLTFNDGSADQYDSTFPLVIRKERLGYEPPLDQSNPIAGSRCCDQIEIVYEDFNQNLTLQPYLRYKITYYAKAIPENNPERFGVFKTVEKWSQLRDASSCKFPAGGSWTLGDDSDPCPECVDEDLVRDHVVDMEFIPFDKNGLIIQSDGMGERYAPAPERSTVKDRLYDIAGVDIRLTFRSAEDFFKANAPTSKKRVVAGLNNRKQEFTDKYLRDSVVVTVNTRNIGGDLFK